MNAAPLHIVRTRYLVKARVAIALAYTLHLVGDSRAAAQLRTEARDAIQVAQAVRRAAA